MIELTDKGREVFKMHHTHHLNLTQEMLTDFSEQEQADLDKAFKKMMKHF
jgi:DNA-binding MarR family transcriptional regulator